MGAASRTARDEQEFVNKVMGLFTNQLAIRSVRLVGSRAEGRAAPLSDWDFAVETTDFERAAASLPRIVAQLAPLGTFWDPLSRHQCFIAILPGPRKVDFIFNELHQAQRPYVVDPETLAVMDVHFWDWTIWLVAKEACQHHEMVTNELRRMHAFLLGPLGVIGVPTTIVEAVHSYLDARIEGEKRYHVTVNPRLSTECLRFLSDAGYRVNALR
jgi:predicted nucleotidyltransferase